VEWFALAAVWKKQSLVCRIKQRFLQWARSIVVVATNKVSDDQIASLTVKGGMPTTGELV
jgi:hypothetical protein